MYYLRIYNYEVNGFGFVVDKIHNILHTDIPILKDDYDLFFKEYNGRDFKIKNVKSTRLFDLLEECFLERTY